ncbi:AAA family ATPase [uncultured Methanolobus sp.]|jgi:Dephospho-CoA kinase|uniref:AAA family ATPase n=1 Tax=uncultured Methanolobus sp. TaxID=218300 RepID=UPI0029C9ADDC|nr:AAA family ATPase [uncultured Methanolobus sp.]
MTKILAFVGMPASGKSEASSVLRRKGITVINMGDVIREEVVRRGLEPTDANTGGVGTDLREKEGTDAVAIRCIPKIKDANEDFIGIDGVRSVAEVERFKEAFGDDFTLVSVDSPIELRFARVLARKRSDDMQDISALKIRDERELGWGMGEAMEIADIVVDNEGTLEEFREKIIGLLD